MKIILSIATGLLLITTSLQAQESLKLPSLISDNMALQAGGSVPIWGWAAPGQKISVQIAEQKQTAVADAKGKWSLKLDRLKAGGPYEMKVQSGAAEITVHNVAVGEVWVCSGQSNMEFQMSSSGKLGAEIAQANFPLMRLFVVKNTVAREPAEDCVGQWVECSPATVSGFSAVGYYFGHKLFQELKVPVGLIEADWGGTTAEAWTSREGLSAVSFLGIFLDRLKTAMDAYPAEKTDYDRQMASFDGTKAKNPDFKKDDTGWEKNDFADVAWRTMTIPCYWDIDDMNFNGSVWFRKTVEIPAAWIGKDLSLSLDAIDDADVTYINGQKVGEMSGSTAPRVYQVPGALVTGTQVHLAIKVTNFGSTAGIYGHPEKLTLRLAGEENGEAVSLVGTWKYEVAERVIQHPIVPLGDPENPTLASSLYNGMIAPLMPYAMRGVIWYQGESNAGRAFQYRTLFPAMIADWRKHWNRGAFTFLFVQLANFTEPAVGPDESEWAELREAQVMTLKTPNTGMSVTIDIGNAKDIHPIDKEDVGLRLARWALAKNYGRKDMVYSGPLYDSMKIKDGKVTVKFLHIGGGLVAKDGPLKRFALAGADKKWAWADAVIEGEYVVVSSPSVPQPVAVRYAWANNPEGCNLYNKEGLPASPFRSDDWPALTDKNQ